MSKKTIIIGVSGIEGSYSEEAGYLYAKKEKIKNCKIAYLVDMEGVLKALSEKRIDIGIFPVVNSTGGIVEDAIKAMGKYNYNLIDYFPFLVRNCLIVKPGTDKKKIKKIVSHPQPLLQCKKYLKKFKGIKIQKYIDNGLAAKDLGSGKLGNNAAVIASESSAKLYNLEILKKGIQDKKDNYTTFLVVK